MNLRKPGPIVTRMQQLTGLTVALGSGSEPAVQPVIDIDDCTEVYGDNVIQLFPETFERCDYSPTHHCEYGGPQDRECKWCRKPSGLDR